MQFTDAALAYRLYTLGNDVTSIAILIGVSRDEVEQAIEFVQDHDASVYPLQTADNDDWRKYEAN
jgi:hypothetical protein